MDEGDALTETLGAVLTNTVTFALAEHPLVVPVTEYVVVTDGLMVILAVVAPLLHKKPDAPLAISVVDPPAQIIDGDALIVTFGEAFTDIVTFALAEQPLVVPVTE